MNRLSFSVARHFLCVWPERPGKFFRVARCGPAKFFVWPGVARKVFDVARQSFRHGLVWPGKIFHVAWCGLANKKVWPGVARQKKKVWPGNFPGPH